MANRFDRFSPLAARAGRAAPLRLARRGRVTAGRSDLRGWVTFLSDGADGLEDKVVKWGRDHAIRTMPLGIFEDADGPPSYKLAPDADVTVLLFTKHKVVANFAFRAGELNDERVKDVMKVVPDLLPKK